MFRENAEGPPPAEPDQAKYFVVVPRLKTLTNKLSRQVEYTSFLDYEKFDTMEEAQGYIEQRHVEDPNAGVYLFYGYMAIPKVEKQVIQHITTTYKSVE